MNFPRFLIEEKLKEFLREDLAFGDITPSPDVDVVAEIVCKSSGVVAGIEVVKVLFEILNVRVKEIVRDGQKVKEGEVVAILEGRAKDVLAGERTALNILERMSGIATATREMVEVAGIRVAATRKTTPGFRIFEKMAVAIGGGDTHRLALGDAVLVKDNHIAVMGIEKAVKAAKRASFTKKVEVEVSSAEDAVKAVKCGADIVMFDNMSPQDVAEAVKMLERLGLRDRVVLEASGGITPENARRFASTGVDVISSGYITHSAKPLDFSLRIRRSQPPHRPQSHSQ